MTSPSVNEILVEEWSRVKALRLASLQDSEEAFGAKYEEELLLTENEWREKFEKLRYLVATVEGIDAGVMSVENLIGDFGATCWVGGCWTDPRFRGKGLMRSMFEYLDAHAVLNDWTIQGLGVWADNHAAIEAYLALGFVKEGEEIASTRHPGKSYIRMIRRSGISPRD